MLFISRYWFPTLIIVILSFALLKTNIEEEQLKKTIKEQEENIQRLEELSSNELKRIDTLKLIDTVIVKDIQRIQVVTDEKIKSVDTMSVSDMQSFYSERYPVKD